MSYTEGSWRILYAGEDEGLTQEECIAENEPVVSIGPINYAEFANEGTPEERANARLIAAAPELLEHLKMAKALLMESDLKPANVCADIQEVIAKAEGRE